MLFHKECLYRHSCAKDLDILVIKVSYTDDRRTKLKVRYIYRNSKQPTDTVENIIIHKHEYQFWSKVNDTVQS